MYYKPFEALPRMCYHNGDLHIKVKHSHPAMYGYYLNASTGKLVHYTTLKNPDPFDLEINIRTDYGDTSARRLWQLLFNQVLLKGQIENLDNLLIDLEKCREFFRNHTKAVFTFCKDYYYTRWLVDDHIYDPYDYAILIQREGDRVWLRYIPTDSSYYPQNISSLTTSDTEPASPQS